MDIPLYFYAAFKDIDRLAPGSDKSTLKAIGYIDFNKDSQLTILDIGCGVGASTLLLADYFKNSTIEAIDLFSHYLKVLDEKIADNDLDNRVYTCQMDMNDWIIRTANLTLFLVKLQHISWVLLKYLKVGNVF